MVNNSMIPHRVQLAIQKYSLPLFIYDSVQVSERVREVKQYLDEYYYPVKVCPEPGIMQAVVDAGGGIDLCSSGDVDLLSTLQSPTNALSFTSVHADSSLAKRLIRGNVIFDADSISQAMTWEKNGGKVCGLRICKSDQSSVYGIKFGIPVSEIASSIQRIESKEVLVHGLHIHESHEGRSPLEMVERLMSLLVETGHGVLAKMSYINLGGGWPTQDGIPASGQDMAMAIDHIKKELAPTGFKGRLTAEPGEWLIGAAGYWVSKVSAIKPHPFSRNKQICILDTATPIPCRPSKAPFILLNSSGEIKKKAPGVWDIFGSANNGTDAIGCDIPLGHAQPGDIVISCCQGAYVRSLTSSFNERTIPGVAIV